MPEGERVQAKRGKKIPGIKIAREFSAGKGLTALPHFFDIIEDQFDGGVYANAPCVDAHIVVVGLAPDLAGVVVVVSRALFIHFFERGGD